VDFTGQCFDLPDTRAGLPYPVLLIGPVGAKVTMCGTVCPNTV
jgi:hypothetical protein